MALWRSPPIGSLSFLNGVTRPWTWKREGGCVTAHWTLEISLFLSQGEKNSFYRTKDQMVHSFSIVPLIFFCFFFFLLRVIRLTSSPARHWTVLGNEGGTSKIGAILASRLSRKNLPEGKKRKKRMGDPVRPWPSTSPRPPFWGKRADAFFRLLTEQVEFLRLWLCYFFFLLLLLFSYLFLPHVRLHKTFTTGEKITLILTRFNLVPFTGVFCFFLPVSTGSFCRS